MRKKKVVVKLGSSSLTTASGELSRKKLTEHVEAIVQLKKAGHKVVLVSSGAVAAGFSELGYPFRPSALAGKQAAAAVGQGLLLQAYTEAFRSHGIVAAQLLLTRQNLLQKIHYQNASAALSELLNRNALPIINENDSVTAEGITFGDNDMLSALVSGIIHADFLAILTDVNGIYSDNPKANPEAQKYTFLPEIHQEVLQAADGAGSSVGTGGMKSKLEAAQTAMALGVQVFIGTGTGKDKLTDILAGKGDGTYIGLTSQPNVKTAKQWLSLCSQPSGVIHVDAGAAHAILNHGKSLLPVGITATSGRFSAGDVVEVTGPNGKVIGRGQVNFSAEELLQIKGLPSKEAMKKAGSGHQVVIHRSQWASTARKEFQS